MRSLLAVVAALALLTLAGCREAPVGPPKVTTITVPGAGNGGRR